MTVAAAAVEKEGHATNVLCFGAPAILPRSFLEDDSYCDQICTKGVLIKARNTNQNTLQCLIAGVLILGVLEAQMSEKVLNKDFNFLGIKYHITKTVLEEKKNFEKS